MDELRGLKALVCGASKGIGREIAIELSQRGVDILAVARSESALKALNLPYTCVDFSKVEAVSDFIENLKGEFHILICNSGGPAGGPLHEASVGEFQSAFQSHLYTNHLLMMRCLPFMKKEKFGRIINILSTSVKAPLPNLGVSNTLRAAVASWAKTLAYELGPFGITVNNVLPGATETERLSSLMEKAARSRGVDQDEVKKEWLSQIPARRFASPQETAKAVSFLASPQASYINGINLPVDGGRLPCL